MPENPTNTDGKLPAVPANEDKLPARVPLVPEASDFLEGDSPAADKVEAFLSRALEATGSEVPTTAGALVPWICDALLSNHPVKAYGRDLMDSRPRALSPGRVRGHSNNNTCVCG